MGRRVSGHACVRMCVRVCVCACGCIRGGGVVVGGEVGWGDPWWFEVMAVGWGVGGE